LVVRQYGDEIGVVVRMLHPIPISGEERGNEREWSGCESDEWREDVMSSLKLLMLVKLTVVFGVRWKREEKLKENKRFD